MLAGQIDPELKEFMSKFKVKFGEFMLEVAATPFAWDQNISNPPAGTAGHLSPNYSAGGWWLFFFSSLQSVQSVPAAPRLQIFALQKSGWRVTGPPSLLRTNRQIWAAAARGRTIETLSMQGGRLSNWEMSLNISQFRT